MRSTLKLPFTFDAEAMRRDVELFADGEWTPHFNTQYYEGDWSGIALRAAADAHVELYPDPTASSYVDTPQLGRCSYIPELLSVFECETEAVRFLRLGPGAVIREHRDYRLSISDGVARVHVPIITSDKVAFHLDYQPLKMEPGEAWYLNFNLPHSVRNEGDEPRVHLVIDCIANDWLRNFFDNAGEG